MANILVKALPQNYTETKALIAMGAILVSIGLSWGSLNGQIALLNQKTDNMIQTTNDSKLTISNIQDKQQSDELELARLQTIVDGAQAKGLLSKVPTPTKNTLAEAIPNIGTLSPTPTPVPAPIIINNTIQQRSAPTPTPRPTTTPTRPTPTPALPIGGGIVGGVLGILGL